LGISWKISKEGYDLAKKGAVKAAKVNQRLNHNFSTYYSINDVI